MSTHLKKLILLVPDLVARSNIKGAINHLQIESISTRTIDDLKSHLTGEGEAGSVKLLIDLNHTNLNPFEVIMIAAPIIGHENIISYFSHVNGELKSQAEDLGLTKIYPRSKFFNDIENIISQ